MPPKHILLVDDDTECLNSMFLLLTLQGLLVTTAETAQEAWTLIVKNGRGAFDLLITDLQMPGMSGIELIDRVREEGDSMPILVITAFRQQHDLTGLTDVLDKPFTAEKLLARVRALLDRATGTEDTVSSAADPSSACAPANSWKRQET